MAFFLIFFQNGDPKRMCIFCEKLYKCLTKHIKRTHSDIKEVKEALMLENPHERVEEFRKIKIRGIYEFNSRVISSGNQNEIQVARRHRGINPSGKVFSCGQCKQFLSSKNFRAHRCIGIKKTRQFITVPKTDKLFKERIMPQIQNDTIGFYVRNSNIVQLIGYETYKVLRESRKER